MHKTRRPDNATPNGYRARHEPLPQDVLVMKVRRARGAGKTFDDGYAILAQNFPPNELETREKMLAMLKNPDFHFYTVYEGRKTLGARFWTDAHDVGVYATMIAIAKDAQSRSGNGSIAYEIILKAMRKEIAATHLDDAVVFSEVEVPQARRENFLRDVLRPGFHDKHTRIKAVADLVYLLPDLGRSGKEPMRVLLSVRNIAGPLETISSKKVAEIVHWLYFEYYHKTYGIPLAEMVALFERVAPQLLGRVPVPEETADRKMFVAAVPEKQMQLRKISEMAE